MEDGHTKYIHKFAELKDVSLIQLHCECGGRLDIAEDKMGYHLLVSPGVGVPPLWERLTDKEEIEATAQWFKLARRLKQVAKEAGGGKA